MKKNIYIAVWISLLCTLISCSKMNDTQKEFLDRGESIYAAKIDSAKALAGDMRQQIDIYFSAPRIASGRIYYNMKQDSIDFEMPKDGSRKLSIVIDDLEETEYNYTILTFDEYGNKSLPTEITGRVYGRFYGDYLLKRTIIKEDITHDGSVVIDWKPISDIEGLNLTYTTTADQTKTIFIPSSESQTTLRDAKPFSNYSYTTVYRPEEFAIDSICSIPLTRRFHANKAQISILALDSNTKTEFGWIPENLYDGNLDNNNGWHTWMNDTWPHQMAFDLGKSYQLRTFRIHQRIYNNDENFAFRSLNPRKYTLMGTNDTPDSSGNEAGWTEIGSFESVKPSGLPLGQLTPEDTAYAIAGEEYEITDTGTYRYVKIKVTESWDGQKATHFMEIIFYGDPKN